MRITRLKESHLNAVCSLIATAWDNPVKDTRKELRTLISHGSGFVAFDGKKIVGVCAYIKAYSHDEHYLNYLVVTPSHRRQGIAKALLTAFTDAARKETPQQQNLAISSTDIKNEISIKMHESFGFKRMGILKNLHYGRDEIFFSYDLR